MIIETKNLLSGGWLLVALVGIVFCIEKGELHTKSIPNKFEIQKRNKHRTYILVTLLISGILLAIRKNLDFLLFQILVYVLVFYGSKYLPSDSKKLKS